MDPPGPSDIPPFSGFCTDDSNGVHCRCKAYQKPEDPEARAICQECGHGRSHHDGKPSTSLAPTFQSKVDAVMRNLRVNPDNFKQAREKTNKYLHSENSQSMKNQKNKVCTPHTLAYV